MRSFEGTAVTGISRGGGWFSAEECSCLHTRHLWRQRRNSTSAANAIFVAIFSPETIAVKLVTTLHRLHYPATTHPGVLWAGCETE